MRRWLFLLVLAVVFLGATTAQAAAPPGPRLGFIRLTFRLRAQDFNHSFGLNLLTADALGTQPEVLLGDALNTSVVPFSGPSWSPDGSTLAVSGASSFNGSLPYGDIYVLGADGSGLRQVTQLGDASLPVFSADGQTIFFARTVAALRGPSVSIRVIGIDGSGLRQLTPRLAPGPARRFVLDLPGSVSPLSGDLAFTRAICHRHPLKCRSSARILSPTTGAETLLAPNADSPAFSPDGQRVALESYRDHNWRKPKPPQRNPLPPGELYARDLSTGSMRRLTRTRGVYETLSSWDPSGQRIAFLREGGVDRIFEINADGSCATPLTKRPRHGKHHLGPQYLGVAWQPGPGREAGRIAC